MLARVCLTWTSIPFPRFFVILPQEKGSLLSRLLISACNLFASKKYTTKKKTVRNSGTPRAEVSKFQDIRFAFSLLFFSLFFEEFVAAATREMHCHKNHKESRNCFSRLPLRTLRSKIKKKNNREKRRNDTHDRRQEEKKPSPPPPPPPLPRMPPPTLRFHLTERNS